MTMQAPGRLATSAALSVGPGAPALLRIVRGLADGMKAIAKHCENVHFVVSASPLGMPQAVGPALL